MLLYESDSVSNTYFSTNDCDSNHPIENIIGGQGNDTITGDGLDNSISGNAGNDFLDGGFGFDIIDGGSGNDTTTYDFFSGPIVANLATGTVGFPGNSDRTDTLISIENIIGSRGNDTLGGNDDNNRILGNTGNDQIVGRSGRDRLFGQDGNDRIDGGADNDTIQTGTGADTIVLRRNGGFDRVRDFQDEADTFDLTGRLQFGQLSIRQRRDDVIVSVGDTNLLRIDDINTAQLSRTDFI
ncbi:MAG: hypothetical protein IGR76_17230 [Synechococcales cyanobacterium T60_A2020_003]|nr:hypothetical protein [Synechococcales cyanobacterium T60_A2020_003]